MPTERLLDQFAEVVRTSRAHRMERILTVVKAVTRAATAAFWVTSQDRAQLIVGDPVRDAAHSLLEGLARSRWGADVRILLDSEVDGRRAVVVWMPRSDDGGGLLYLEGGALTSAAEAMTRTRRFLPFLTTTFA